MSEPTKIEAPEELARRVTEAKRMPPRAAYNVGAWDGIVADREQIAAWCIESAKEEREAAPPLPHSGLNIADACAAAERRGAARALEALAAILGGAK